MKLASTIKLRKVEQKDARGYIELVNYVWRIAYAHIFPEEVFLEREGTAEERIKSFDAKKLNDDQTVCFVAEDNSKVVGVMLGTTNSDYEHFKSQGYADLCVLYVLPEYQGQGIASKLKEIFLDFAKEKGYDKFVIGVLKENHKARLIYEKWGGKLDEYASFITKLGKNYDEVFYVYDI